MIQSTLKTQAILQYTNETGISFVFELINYLSFYFQKEIASFSLFQLPDYLIGFKCLHFNYLFAAALSKPAVGTATENNLTQALFTKYWCLSTPVCGKSISQGLIARNVMCRRIASKGCLRRRLFYRSLLQGAASQGANSVAIRNNKNRNTRNSFVVVGEDFMHDQDTTKNCVITKNGGKTCVSPTARLPFLRRFYRQK